jgi:hypothetical protein
MSVEGIAFRYYLVPTMISITLTYDRVMYVLGLFHNKGVRLPQGRRTLYVCVDYCDLSLGYLSGLHEMHCPGCLAIAVMSQGYIHIFLIITG